MVKPVYRDLNGIILLDKAEGASSNNVLQKVRHLFQAKKAGHTGALDPLATGMLPICFGEATKYSQYLLDSDKGYEVTALLGQRTDTSDSDGEVVETRDVNVTEEQIRAEANLFVGKQLQTPSVYSALKYQGKPLYWYARQGIDVPRPTREITFYSIEVLSVELPYVRMRVVCSKGTYIRTLVDDLGEKLGCGAHVTQLRRIKVADYPYEQILTLEAMADIAEQGLDALDQHLLPIDTALHSLPTLKVTEEQETRLKQGQRFYPEAPHNAGMYRVYVNNEHFIGIVEVLEQGLIQPRKIMVQN